MRCPTKYLRGRISNYNNNSGGTAETSDSYISDWNKCISSSGTVGGESDFLDRLIPQAQLERQTCILLQWEFFHSRVWFPIMGTQTFHFSLLWSPFHQREVWLFVPFPKLRLGTTRSRFCLHGNQGSFTCIHVSSRLSPNRSNANYSIPGKSFHTGRTSQQ